nr:hypothetical protein [Tanacetum cinerariifolium]
MVVSSSSVFHLQTDDELSDKKLKQIKADDQAIQTIILSLPEDIYAAVDSCETTQEIWLRVQQIMKGSDIGIQEKKDKLFNEWERKTKDLHIADYTQLYDFLKYNQKEVDELKVERLAKTQDPLALMANSNNPYVFLAPYQDQSSFNQTYLQQPMTNPKDITDPTSAMNMALALMAKAFKLNYSTLTNNNQRISSNPRNKQIAQLGMNMGQDRQMQMVRGNGGNQFRQYARNPAGYNDAIGNQNQIENGNLVVACAEGNATGQNGNQIRCYNCRGVGHYARNCIVRPRRRDAAYLQIQLLIAQKEEAGIQLQVEEYDLMAAAADLDEIEEVNANCILMANLQQASTSGTQTDSVLVYDTDGSTEVHENCDDNEIFNMFTQEEQYTELLEPIPESYQVPQNDNVVISEDTSVEQAIEVEKVNSVNRKLKETNADMTTELARYKNPSHVYKLKKALYGLKQAPRAWYDELSKFLLQNHFFKGTIDPTLFIRHFQDDILVSKYVLKILKKYGMESCDPVGTLIEIKDKLDLDQNGTLVYATKHRSMIDALMYLMSRRPDIVHATCLCARYQAKPTEKHLKEVKRIFRYLQGTVNMGLWYTKDFGFELTGFSDADYAGCKDTFKSTSGGTQFLGEKLVSQSLKKQDCTTLSTAEAEYVSLSACCAQVL